MDWGFLEDFKDFIEGFIVKYQDIDRSVLLTMSVVLSLTTIRMSFACSRVKFCICIHPIVLALYVAEQDVKALFNRPTIYIARSMAMQAH